MRLRQPSNVKMYNYKYMFAVYVLLGPFAVVASLNLIQRVYAKVSSQRLSTKLVIAGLILQLIPLPRTPFPYGTTTWTDFDTGEPWAIGLGYPASYLKLYLGSVTCQPEIVDYCESKTYQYHTGMIKFVGDSNPITFNFFYIFATAGLLTILITLKKGILKKR